MLRCQCPSVCPSVCDVCALWSQGAIWIPKEWYIHRVYGLPLSDSHGYDLFTRKWASSLGVWQTARFLHVYWSQRAYNLGELALLPQYLQLGYYVFLQLLYGFCCLNKKHLKNVGPIRHASRRTPNQQVSLPVLSHAACASMSTTPTTATTTTTRERGDRYGRMEWAQ